ncbi:hypothetical protein DSO57_1039460 [Entomophthora muscae]|uniref:Uncharacterized protein n=1 Tax=Entomophthora muscae TaxID=34485 RepID=A0ACC2RD44_9FUNG|nr:hypothetical protein DSO57_1039460 [Entomophthora muscae]
MLSIPFLYCLLLVNAKRDTYSSGLKLTNNNCACEYLKELEERYPLLSCAVVHFNSKIARPGNYDIHRHDCSIFSEVKGFCVNETLAVIVHTGDLGPADICHGKAFYRYGRYLTMLPPEEVLQLEASGSYKSAKHLASTSTIIFISYALCFLW